MLVRDRVRGTGGTARDRGTLEAVLTRVLGQPYADYRLRTKRLVPGLW